MELLRRLADRAARLWRAVFAAAADFGFSALGIAPPGPPEDEEGGKGGEPARAAFSPDELLWMAELEDRDSF
jgi:glycine/D-amino acid oxidase-like deaminating enzyme